MPLAVSRIIPPTRNSLLSFETWCLRREGTVDGVAIHTKGSAYSNRFSAVPTHLETPSQKQSLLCSKQIEGGPSGTSIRGALGEGPFGVPVSSGFAEQMSIGARPTRSATSEASAFSLRQLPTLPNRVQPSGGPVECTTTTASGCRGAGVPTLATPLAATGPTAASIVPADYVVTAPVGCYVPRPPPTSLVSASHLICGVMSVLSSRSCPVFSPFLCV
ncbi:hypothetical protein cyc_00701 [Cyclospora cayetanensis]|uniref:Uncharacterized protein n=1 Tax=Cyclospora cayetanensis TaxID=88456 RepID=A0A1D3CRB7_9EIME|nr:hypothetical protein cyc_00701 [Cyclospora cayetanensis]